MFIAIQSSPLFRHRHGKFARLSEVLSRRSSLQFSAGGWAGGAERWVWFRGFFLDHIELLVLLFRYEICPFQRVELRHRDGKETINQNKKKWGKVSTRPGRRFSGEKALISLRLMAPGFVWGFPKTNTASALCCFVIFKTVLSPSLASSPTRPWGKSSFI